MAYYINIGQSNYHKSLPAFYDKDSCIESINIIENNASTFIAEWEQYIEQQKQDPKLFFLYNEKGWNTIMLYSYGLRYHKNCTYFANTLKILEQLKNIVTLYFSTLEPGTKLKPHYGDTDATYRIHLGLNIPSGLPDCGIEVGGVQKEWQNNKTIIFNDAHFHTAWNLTTQTRTVLIIDIIKPEFQNQKFLILTKVLGTLGIGRLLYPLRISNKLPKFSLKFLHFLATLAFMIILPIQRMLKVFYK